MRSRMGSVSEASTPASSFDGGSEDAPDFRPRSPIRANKNAARAFGLGGVFGFDCEEVLTVLCRPGSDLLSQGLSHSTIGAEEFNGRVRDGIGFRLLARTTRPAKDREYEASSNASAFERSPRT